MEIMIQDLGIQPLSAEVLHHPNHTDQEQLNQDKNQKNNIVSHPTHIQLKDATHRIIPH